MRGLRVKLAIGVAVLGAVVVAAAATAGDHARLRHAAERLRGGAGDLHRCRRHVPRGDPARRGRDRVRAALRRPHGRGAPGAHPPRAARRERRHHRLPVLQPRQRPGRHPGLPAAAGAITGTITADQVVGLPAQGIAARELDELVDALRAGVAYANVHSETFPTARSAGRSAATAADRGAGARRAPGPRLRSRHLVHHDRDAGALQLGRERPRHGSSSPALPPGFGIVNEARPRVRTTRPRQALALQHRRRRPLARAFTTRRTGSCGAATAFAAGAGRDRGRARRVLERRGRRAEDRVAQDPRVPSVNARKFGSKPNATVRPAPTGSSTTAALPPSASAPSA